MLNCKLRINRHQRPRHTTNVEPPFGWLMGWQSVFYLTAELLAASTFIYGQCPLRVLLAVLLTTVSFLKQVLNLYQDSDYILE